MNIANFLRTPIFKNIGERLLLIILPSSSCKFISDTCLYFALKHLKEAHLLRHSQQNVRTIIWLLLCHNIAIIRILVEL